MLVQALAVLVYVTSPISDATEKEDLETHQLGAQPVAREKAKDQGQGQIVASSTDDANYGHHSSYDARYDANYDANSDANYGGQGQGKSEAEGRRCTM